MRGARLSISLNSSEGRPQLGGTSHTCMQPNLLFPGVSRSAKSAEIPHSSPRFALLGGVAGSAWPLYQRRRNTPLFPALRTARRCRGKRLAALSTGYQGDIVYSSHKKVHNPPKKYLPTGHATTTPAAPTPPLPCFLGVACFGALCSAVLYAGSTAEGTEPGSQAAAGNQHPSQGNKGGGGAILRERANRTPKKAARQIELRRGDREGDVARSR